MEGHEQTDNRRNRTALDRCKKQYLRKYPVLILKIPLVRSNARSMTSKIKPMNRRNNHTKGLELFLTDMNIFVNPSLVFNKHEMFVILLVVPESYASLSVRRFF
jgi:hypothetical protein